MSLFQPSATIPLIQNDTVFIIAGGPSVKGLDLKPLRYKGYVLGVNDSIFNTECHAAFTMDGHWLSNRWQSAKAMNIDVFARIRSFSKHVGMDFWWPQLFLYEYERNQPGMSESISRIHGNDSGSCALNYVYLSKPERVFLFGYDLYSNGKEHWYDLYPWRNKKTYGTEHFKKWVPFHHTAARQFEEKGIQVYNVSPESKITAYPRITYKQALGMLS